MKKIITMIALVLCTLAMSAQTNHMKFKGIPMEGTLQSFTNKLKMKGYTPMGIRDGVSVLKGEFAGHHLFQDLLNLSICLLNLPVCLWMVRSRNIVDDAVLVHQCLERSITKMSTLVTDDCTRSTEPR